MTYSMRMGKFEKNAANSTDYGYIVATGIMAAHVRRSVFVSLLLFPLQPLLWRSKQHYEAPFKSSIEVSRCSCKERDVLIPDWYWWWDAYCIRVCISGCGVLMCMHLWNTKCALHFWDASCYFSCPAACPYLLLITSWTPKLLLLLVGKRRQSTSQQSD